ncbi:MAG TPA: iron-sulfur cluster assembly scaffold protein [Dehalococcoidales bacterium]|nr:iron-sulfur cluster assembly scaffold protein [Dehalococcoidales bacterium]
MDEQVIKFYRRLCKEGFEHTGSLENPSIFLDTVGEKIRICSHVSHAFMNIYINIRNGIIEDIKYLCTCDPTANVVVELLCGLVKGKTLAEARTLSAEDFSRALGTTEDEFIKKSTGIIELLHRGLVRYQNAK